MNKTPSPPSRPYEELSPETQAEITRLDKRSIRKEYLSMASVIGLLVYCFLGLADVFPDAPIMSTITASLVGLVAVVFGFSMISSNEDRRKITLFCSDWEDYKKSQAVKADKEYRVGYWIVRGYAILAFVLIVGFVSSGLAAVWLLLALLTIPGIALVMKKEILKDYHDYVKNTGKKAEPSTLKVILGLTD